MKSNHKHTLFLFFIGCALLFSGTAFGKRASTKKPRLKPQEVAKNELIDKAFLTPYKAGIKALQNDKFDAAIKFATAALRKRPQSGRAMLVLGTAYKRKKLYNSAIQYFRQASKVLVGKKVLYEKGQALYNIAFCFELQRQLSSAIIAWQLYVNHAATYHMQNSQVAFARQRVKILQTVKGPPAK